ncbi:inactive serine protease 45 [Drosophila subpulchrella]|uniref:inactive serine protease 45 n=1 Tax=Drosophila subpulchrella TaxID=1486046 RepID=UPI0018A13E61|nr:inactive serine protease 45 [Drosophila subpulchrella]
MEKMAPAFQLSMLPLLLFQLGSAEFLDFNCANRNPNPRSLRRSPWMAFIESSSKNCSGALINQYSVITSASCIFNQSERTVLFRISKNNYERHSVQSGFIHKFFNKNTFKNDIALLILEKPVVFKRRMRPICIWLNMPMNFQNSQNLTAKRWGLAQEKMIPRMNRVSTLDPKKCYESFNKVPVKSQICTVFKGNQRCADQGSPLVSEMLVSGKMSNTLVGIQSYGTLRTCVYTKIQSYIDWIIGVVLEVDVLM